MQKRRTTYISPCHQKSTFVPRHDKTNKVTLHPVKTQISLGIHPVWSESSLSAWRNLGSLATHWAHSEDSDQTGRMPTLSWVFTGRTCILLVLSCHGSFIHARKKLLVYISHYKQLWTYPKARDNPYTSISTQFSNVYRNVPNFPDRQVCANSLDPDQTAHRRAVWS